MSGRGYIAEELDQVCELCGTIAECRPYGPNHEQICFSCGEKDLEMTKLRFEEYVLGIKHE